MLDYCRIDAPEATELALLDVLYNSAVEYLMQAGVAPPTPGSAREAQYDLCICYLVLDAYDQRGSTLTGTIVASNPAFRRLLNQLKMTEPVPESGTGT